MRIALALLCLAACATDAKGVEQDDPVDGLADSLRSPTDHGAIGFGTAETGNLTTTEHYPSWTFQLGTGAEIHAYTHRTPHEAGIDTVLYLYKHGQTGWGSYIAKNDDDASSEWSSIDTTVGIGQYRIIVKGYSTTTHGSFDVSVDCTGAGCAPP